MKGITQKATQKATQKVTDLKKKFDWKQIGFAALILLSMAAYSLIAKWLLLPQVLDLVALIAAVIAAAIFVPYLHRIIVVTVLTFGLAWVMSLFTKPLGIIGFALAVCGIICAYWLKLRTWPFVKGLQNSQIDKRLAANTHLWYVATALMVVISLIQPARMTLPVLQQKHYNPPGAITKSTFTTAEASFTVERNSEDVVIDIPRSRLWTFLGKVDKPEQMQGIENAPFGSYTWEVGKWYDVDWGFQPKVVRYEKIKPPTCLDGISVGQEVPIITIKTEEGFDFQGFKCPDGTLVK